MTIYSSLRSENHVSLFCRNSICKFSQNHSSLFYLKYKFGLETDFLDTFADLRIGNFFIFRGTLFVLRAILVSQQRQTNEGNNETSQYHTCFLISVDLKF